MLLEIRSDVFRTGAIHFHEGLNVILGDERATNSIGKSTLLMIVDFVLGGSTLLRHNADIVTELGDHHYQFVFQFGEDLYRFRRGTLDSATVEVCDEQFQPIAAKTVEEYTALLMSLYEIQLPYISFRSLVGLYLRVWGKENLVVERPLHVARQESAAECVDNLLKTFGRYSAIRQLSAELARANAQAKALTAAKEQGVIPAMSKRDYATNAERIEVAESELADIRRNLAKYATSISEVVSKDVLDLKREKDKLVGLRLGLAGRLDRVRRNLNEKRNIQSANFRDVVTYFPDVNQDRLSRVEEFHNQVARLLRDELKASETELVAEVERIDSAVGAIDERMAQTLTAIDEPGMLVDRVVDLAVTLRDARQENTTYEQLQSVRTQVRELKERWSAEKAAVLTIVQNRINEGMRSVVESVFGGDRKSPFLTLREGSYEFDVFEDTGTGTAYASLIILDLTVFRSTELPVIAHDTVLFKNIENPSVARLIDVYLASPKQSFIALDEIAKYGERTRDKLVEKSVIQLDNENVLYVKDWRPLANRPSSV